MKRICLALLIIVTIITILPNSYKRTMFPRDFRAWGNYLTKDLNKTIWEGNLDLTQNGSSVRAVINAPFTHRYYILSSCNIDKANISRDSVGSQFKGVLQYSFYNDNVLISSQIVNGSLGWMGDFKLGDNYWRELMLQFWMPYLDEYENITIEMKVLDPDPTFMDKRKNVHWSIKGMWLPWS